MNPLLNKFDTKFGVVPFDKIKEEHFLPAIKESIEIAKQEIEAIKNNSEAPTFENTIVMLERSGDQLGSASLIFFNLNSCNTNPEIQKLAQEISPLLSAFGNDITLDEKLFERVKAVYDIKDTLELDHEDEMLLEKTYKDFTRNGALLDEAKKEELRNLDAELSKLSLKFGENNLKATNAFVLIIEDEKDLEGMPEGVIEAAAMTAKEKGHEGKWVFTLDYPSYGPFITHCSNRELRKKMWFAASSKCFDGGEFDNQENVKAIASLRHKRANLLGYDTHSNFVLEQRMAGNPETVVGFMNDILSKAKGAAENDTEELKEFAKKLDGLEEIRAWDATYYVEKLKKEKLNFDDEMLRPYFQLENVRDGAFEVAKRLFGLNFKEVEAPVYHEDVKVYEVTEENGDHVGVFYCDFFPRASKRGGAWATSFRGQEIKDGENIRPHSSIVCNFTKPTDSKPSLLSFREVQTLFHEFGHALHNLLANTKYGMLSGTSVYWDFVELPSQILENWTYEKECLDLFAKHYENGETISEELVAKVRKGLTFREGTMTLRQLGLGLIDMAWYSKDPSNVTDIEALEDEATKETQLLPKEKGTSTSCSFGHIFAGGYSSGYYSYKWAEVLDADAFEFFKEKGIFNKDVAKKFRDNILSQGGTRHPMELYKSFRGAEPTTDALLKRGGLI